MVTSNTALAPGFNIDTYRSNEAARKNALKFRIASEYTVERDIGREEEATNDLAENSQYRLTSQFHQKALDLAGVIPNLVDDIKQKFSGIVIEIDHEKQVFCARISDLTNRDNPDEQVTLDFDEIQESDRRQLTKGDSFVWYIGYVQGRLVSRQGFSKIRFRHLPAWTKQEIDTASNRAEELAHFFQQDPDTST